MALSSVLISTQVNKQVLKKTNETYFKKNDECIKPKVWDLGNKTLHKPHSLGYIK